jgi:hypothetical protein
MYLEYFETTADDFVDHRHRDEKLQREATVPVAEEAYRSFDSRQAKKIINLDAFDDPRCPVRISTQPENERVLQQN